MFKRAQVTDDGFVQGARGGAGWLANIRRTVISADSNQVYPASAMLGGYIFRAGATVSRTDTLDTVDKLLVDLKGMDVGDTLLFKLINGSSATIVFSPGAGVTGSPISVASGTGHFVLLERTTATTFSIADLL